MGERERLTLGECVWETERQRERVCMGEREGERVCVRQQPEQVLRERPQPSRPMVEEFIFFQVFLS